MKTPIKLPVHAYQSEGGLWNIRTSANERIASELSEHRAQEIANALNIFSGLVEALRDAVEILEKDFDYRPDDGSHWDNIKAALASAEEVNTTTQAL